MTFPVIPLRLKDRAGRPLRTPDRQIGLAKTSFKRHLNFADKFD